MTASFIVDLSAALTAEGDPLAAVLVCSLGVLVLK
jgi:hypothetical protein